MVLWKRELESADAPFIDLFKKFESPHLLAAIEKWDRRLEAAEWKNQFMLEEIAPGKSNKTSDYFRKAGNCKFREKDFIGAMELYSLSLCFAEPETNNVSFAYANRATCFLRMEKFDKCIADIDLAVEANYPFMEKLMERKSECQQQQAMERAGSKTDAIEIKLDYERNEKYPCMADVLCIRKNTEYGRHVIAKCDIAVGLTVLIEKSFISLGDAFDRVQCYGCLKEEQNFIACPKCTDVMFCSKACQNNIIHEKICGENLNRMPSEVRYLAESVLAGLFAFSSADDMMQFVDVILQKRTEVPPAANDQKSKYALFLYLQPSKRITLDIEPSNVGNLTDVNMIIELIYKVFKALMAIPLVSAMFNTLKRQRFLTHLIAEHSFILANNSFKLDVPGGVIGRKVGLVSSLFNHACAPNVFNATNIGGDLDIFISIRPIKKGDQVFIGYGYPLEDLTKVRHAQLKQKYNFDCKCDKCEPHSAPSDRSLMAANANFKFLLANRFNRSTENMANLKYNCIAFLNEFGHLPWTKEMDMVLDTFTNILFEELKIEY